MTTSKRRRRGMVRVAHGNGWELLYPAVIWWSMTPEQQETAVARQTATIEQLIHAHESYPPEVDNDLFMPNMQQ